MACAVLADGAAIHVDHLLERFSSWHSLKKLDAWILRYKASLCAFCVRDKKKPVKPVVKSVIEPISVLEMREAKRSIVSMFRKSTSRRRLNALRDIRMLQLWIQAKGPKEVQFRGELTVHKEKCCYRGNEESGTEISSCAIYL